VPFRHLLAVGTTVFVSGAVLLGVEIAASRVLAPFFGNSLFVWGALIGVVLTGLALGYWAGGALADRLPATGLLLGVVTLAAALVLAIPLVDGPALELIVSWDPGPRLNPLLAAIALFGLPSVVMAGVTPIAVRLLARSLATVGRTAGRLFALSTAGSIAGTFATAFFLIPEFGTDQLLGLAATALFACVALVALVERLPLAVAVAVAGAMAAGVASSSLAPAVGGTLRGAAAENWSPVYRLRGEDTGTAPDFAGEDVTVVFSRDTRYHRLAVVDDEDSRYLRFDSSFQSAMWLERPFATRFDYTDFFHLGLAYRPEARDVLFVGLGGASAPKRMWRDFRDLRIHVVELDPVVADVAYRYFRLPRDPRLTVDIADGRRFLQRDDRRWDVIAIDAYFADSIPFHLTTHEFLQLVRSRLRPGGVVLANVIGALEGPGSRLFRALVRTYRTAFPTVLVHPVGEENEVAVRNIILVGTEGAAPERGFLAERWAQVRARSNGAPDLRDAISKRYDREIPTQDVPTLTDGYAPTDALLLLGR
jgi:spermidine synthase